MNLEDAKTCLQDYNRRPLPGLYSGSDHQSASISSHDGERFDVYLDDYDGPSDVFRTLEDYRVGIADLRRQGEHRRHTFPHQCDQGFSCPGHLMVSEEDYARFSPESA